MLNTVSLVHVVWSHASAFKLTRHFRVRLGPEFRNKWPSEGELVRGCNVGEFGLQLNRRGSSSSNKQL